MYITLKKIKSSGGRRYVFWSIPLVALLFLIGSMGLIDRGYETPRILLWQLQSQKINPNVKLINVETVLADPTVYTSKYKTIYRLKIDDYGKLFTWATKNGYVFEVYGLDSKVANGEQKLLARVWLTEKYINLSKGNLEYKSLDNNTGIIEFYSLSDTAEVFNRLEVRLTPRVISTESLIPKTYRVIIKVK